MGLNTDEARESDLPGMGRGVGPMPSTPAGLWLRSGEVRPVGGGEPIIDGLLEAGRCVLLVGGPGASTPAAMDVAEIVRLLTGSARPSLVVNVYGREPDEDVSLAQQLADLLGVPVRARHGFTLPGLDGIAHRTLIDGAGRPAWRPFVQLSRYHPRGTGAMVEQCSEPVPGAEPVGRGSYRLTDHWTVDVVPAGVVVRPAAVLSDPALRVAPADPDRVDLTVVANAGQVLPDALISSLGRFADALPPEARSRLRVVLTAAPAPASDRALRSAVPAPHHLRAETTRQQESGDRVNRGDDTSVDQVRRLRSDEADRRMRGVMSG